MNASEPLATLSLATSVPDARYAVSTASGTVYALAVADDRLSARVVRMRGDAGTDDAPPSTSLYADGEAISVTEFAFEVGFPGTLIFHDVEARIEVSEKDYCGTIRTTTKVQSIERVEG